MFGVLPVLANSGAHCKDTFYHLVTVDETGLVMVDDALLFVEDSGWHDGRSLCITTYPSQMCGTYDVGHKCLECGMQKQPQMVPYDF